MRTSTLLPLLGLMALALPLSAQAPTLPVHNIKPVLATAKVSQDPDDPAIWVNKRNPSKSLILGTNKIKASDGGAMYVFDLDGKVKQIIPNIDRPNNVDVEYGLKLGGRRVDIAVLTERLQHRLRIFAIPQDGGKLVDLAPKGLPVFKGETGDASEPMGISLYKRPKDGAIFAVIGRKSGPSKGYLHIAQLQDDGTGTPVLGTPKAFGAYSGKKEIESIAVDDEFGYIYYSDETVCVRKYPADPDSPYFGQELATLGREGRQGDHEGIAIYTKPNGTGYIVSTDQIKGNTRYFVYKREGEPGKPHEHREHYVVQGGADETDGIEITSARLGKRFPHGLFVAMDSTPKDFLVYRAEDVIRR